MYSEHISHVINKQTVSITLVYKGYEHYYYAIILLLSDVNWADESHAKEGASAHHEWGI